MREEGLLLGLLPSWRVGRGRMDRKRAALSRWLQLDSGERERGEGERGRGEGGGRFRGRWAHATGGASGSGARKGGSDGG